MEAPKLLKSVMRSKGQMPGGGLQQIHLEPLTFLAPCSSQDLSPLPIMALYMGCQVSLAPLLFTLPFPSFPSLFCPLRSCLFVQLSGCNSCSSLSQTNLEPFGQLPILLLHPWPHDPAFVIVCVL